MGIMYDDYKYAHSRLADTVILDDGKIAHVKAVSNNGTVILAYLCNSDQLVKRPLKEIDTTPIRLGYVNLPTGCLYTSRAPVRRDYRQGLNHNTLRVSSLSTFHVGSFKFSWLKQPALNDYPKFSECLNVVSSGGKLSQAFCRDFCLSKDKDIQVHYKGKYVVGMVVNGVINLFEDFTYLRERLSQYVD